MLRLIIAAALDRKRTWARYLKLLTDVYIDR